MFGRIIRRLCVGASVAAVVMSGLTGPPAVADAPSPPDPVQLNLPHVRVMLTDAVHGLVYAGGHGGLVVVPADGSSAAVAVPNAPTVSSLAQGADAARVYVGSETGQIVALDAADPTHGTRQVYKTSALTDCVTSLAVGPDGRVWFGYGGCTSGAGGFGVLDPSAGTFTLNLAKTLFSRTGLLPPVIVANNAAAPQTLVLTEDGIDEMASPALLATLDVSSATPTVVDSNNDHPGGTSLAVSADGSTVFVGRTDAQPVRYGTADLSDPTVLESGPLSNFSDSAQVAVSPDDATVAALDETGAMTYDRLSAAPAPVRRCGGDDNDVDSALAWAGTTLLTARDAMYGAELVRCTNAAVPQTYIGATVPSTPLTTGRPTSFTVTLVNHGAPISGATISITRTDNGGDHALNAVTTGADGTVTVTDTVTKPGPVTYRVAFAGDDTHEAATATYYTSAYQANSSLTASAARSVKLDGAVSLSARLTDRDTGVPLAGASLRVVRIDSTGRHDLGSVKTSTTGRIAVSDHATAGPTAKYQVSYAGNVTYSNSTATWVVAVTRLRPTIAAMLAHTTTGYNGPSTVRVHLSHTVSRIVRVVATPHYGRPHVIATKAVNSAGNLTVTTHVTKRTVITVSFAGDSRYAPVQISRTQFAAAGVNFTMTGQTKVTKGVHVYKAGKVFGLVGSVHPYRNNACMYFEGYYVQSGKTHGLGRSSCFRTSNSIARAIYRADKYGIRGVTYYFRSVFLGDYDNVATASPWVRSRIA